MALAQQSGDILPTKTDAGRSLAGATRGATRKWARRVVSAIDDCAPIDLVQKVALAVRFEVDPSSLGSDPTLLSLDGLEPPAGGWGNPWLLGLLHEHAVSDSSRKSRGAWYTPETVVRGLVSLAVADGEAPLAIFDPTCGGGAFLLAAADRLVEMGISPKEALDRVGGTDIDEDAVLVSKLSLQLWALQHGVERSLEEIRVEVGDALHGFPTFLMKPMVVVGNPPFASPLRKGAIPETAERYRSNRSELLAQYADLAAIHLLSAVDQAGPGSTVVLVQPQSVLASRDTEGLRTHLAENCAVESLWVSREAVFDAGVRVCAPVIKVTAAPAAKVKLWTGPKVESAGSTDPVSWASCAARALGAPSLPHECWSPSETLSSLASATAGFRDEYYGLVEACFELPTGSSHDEAPPVSVNGQRFFDRLLTVGSVEPLFPLWGIRPTRLGGVDWQRPVVDRVKLNDKVLRWVERQAQPKVVLATQSKVLEPVIDFDGSFVPVTPLIAVHAAQDDLRLISAVLLAPPVVSWAWELWFGSAMAVDALKLAAKQVLELPLPPDRQKWERAASLIMDDQSPSLEKAQEVAIEVAALMTEAYRAERQVFDWWRRRLG